MINKLKLFLATLLIIPSLMTGIALAAASTNPLDAPCAGKDKILGTADDINSPVCNDKGSGTADPVSGSNGVIGEAVNIIALVAGVGAVIMIFIGAFFYVTAAGNSENVAKARARIVSAFVGLAIVTLAWLLVSFAVDKLIQ